MTILHLMRTALHVKGMTLFLHLGLLLGTEVHIMTPNGVKYIFVTALHLSIQLTAFCLPFNRAWWRMQPLKCLCGSAKCRGFIGGKEVANRAEDPRYDAVLLLVSFCMLCTCIKLGLCLVAFHAFGFLLVLPGIEYGKVQQNSWPS